MVSKNVNTIREGRNREDLRREAAAREGNRTRNKKEEGNKDSGSKETGRKDTGSKETGRRDPASRETGRKDTGSRETGRRDTGSRETGRRDTGSRETGRRDPGSKETGRRDHLSKEAGRNRNKKEDSRKEFSGKEEGRNRKRKETSHHMKKEGGRKEALAKEERKGRSRGHRKDENRRDAVLGREEKSRRDPVSGREEKNRKDAILGREEKSRKDAVLGREEKSRRDPVLGREEKSRKDPVLGREEEGRKDAVSRKEEAGRRDDISRKDDGSRQELNPKEAPKQPAIKEKTVTVIGVRFRKNGKIYYFSPGDFTVHTGDHVIVETARGIEYGSVVLGSREVVEKKIVSTLKPVIRIATEADDQTHERNKKKSKEAFDICLEKISNHKLDMKLVDCEYTFDNNKVLFYFTADGRIDFRELVKDLASVFRTRIELRQIGVRDETKIKGGIGICGRCLCCNCHLSEFIPVSIKMAKEQNLSLNPTKISGVCGRLMCCLKNEQDTYEYLNRKLPSHGDEVILPEGGKAMVQSVNVLRQKVRVIITDEHGEKEMAEYPAKELRFHTRKKKGKDRDKIDAELKKLEALEKDDKGAGLD